MKAICQRYLMFTALCGLAFFASLAIIVYSHKHYITVSALYIVVSASLAILLFILSIGEYRNLVFAQLIVDNKIILVQAAHSEQKSWKHNAVVLSADSMDIYISCFGILLGSRIIKFNTEGIYLKRIDIGGDFIEIYFGKGEREQFIRLINKTTDINELLCIIEQFRRETGVIPKIIT